MLCLSAMTNALSICHDQCTGVALNLHRVPAYVLQRNTELSVCILPAACRKVGTLHAATSASAA